MEKFGQENSGQKWSTGSAVLSGQQILTKKDLKGPEHPMADAFGESSNRPGENDDILGHHQIPWMNGKDGVQPTLQLWDIL